MKVSSVLTLSALIGGLLGASGCIRQRVMPAPAAGQAAAIKATFQDFLSPVPAAEPTLPPTNSLKAAVAPDAPIASSNRVFEPPPLPQIELVGPQPSRNHVWLPGRWVWENGWTWVSGRWIVAPERNAAWIPGRWVQRGTDGWVWVEGHWRPTALN